MYEASVRHVDQDLGDYIYKSFLYYLKDFRIAKYPIAVIFFTYIYIVFPSLKDRLFNKDLWKNLPFAFDIDSIEDFTDGNVKLVFKVNFKNGKSYVIKLNKYTIGIALADLHDIALLDKCEYDEVMRWYGDLDIVLPTSFLVVNTPFDSLPAAASIQEFQTATMFDIFEYIASSNDVFCQMSLYPDFAYQLYQYAKRTLDIYNNRHRCMDIMGRKNIVILCEQDGSPKLKILDTESIIYFDKTGYIDGPDMAIIRRKLDLLQLVVDYFEENLIREL